MGKAWIVGTVLSLFVLLLIRPSLCDMLEVYVIPHSHDDVGWIITLDQYYDARVQFIYDTVISSLTKNPQRKFSVVEVGFLKKWWEKATETERSDFKRLHENGQIEFLIGGIVMNDEAATTYDAIINQMQVGHKFLKEEFGDFPSIGWQIDPFGASKGTPTILSWDCFDALIIDRIPYHWKDSLQNNKSMEFLWHGTSNLGEETTIFTHIMDQYGYCMPRPFAYSDTWNIYFTPNPNPPINDLNIAKQAQLLVDNFNQRAQWYATNHLLWPFGCDFNYQNADTMFKNMDILIQYINERQSEFNINVRYAHVSDYIEALYNTTYTWPEYSGDFFPYNDRPASYWTGYYTSRNELKVYSRKADAILRSAEILSVLAESYSLPFNLSTSFSKLEKLRFESAVAQHHDAISGTARPNVIKDYIFRLWQGVTLCQNQTAEMISLLSTSIPSPHSTSEYVTYDPSTITSDPISVLPNNNDDIMMMIDAISESSTQHTPSSFPTSLRDQNDYNKKNDDVIPSSTMIDFEETERSPHLQNHQLGEIGAILLDNLTAVITTFNSLPYRRNDIISVFIPTGMEVKVTDQNNQVVASQIDIIPSHSEYERLYISTDVAGLGYATYFITPLSSSNDNSASPRSQLIESPSEITISNNILSLSFVNASLISYQVNDTYNQLEFDLQLSSELMCYKESTALDQPGGAYIFRNDNNEGATPWSDATSNNSEMFFAMIGPIVQTYYQIFEYETTINQHHLHDPCGYLDIFEVPVTSNTTIAYRVYENQNYAELEYEMGPIGFGYDYIMRFTTPNITGPHNANLFYQDDNALLTMQRTYNPHAKPEIPGNYYPVVSSAYIEDDDLRMSVISSRSQGGASLEAGQMELMLHRRTKRDDRRGVFCPLDDISRISFRHILNINSTSLAETYRQRYRLILNNPLSLVVGSTTSVSSWVSSHLPVFEPMAGELPLNVYLLSLEFYGDKNDSVILRLQHLFEDGSDPTYAVPVTVNINTFFQSLSFSNIQEVAISANQSYEECSVNRLHGWNSSKKERKSMKKINNHHTKLSGSDITLLPGQIRSFTASLSLV